MPFGLTNTPAVFQAMINNVLREFLDHFVYVYLNDILVYSLDHQDQENQVLKRLLENHLYVKQKKVCVMLNLSRSWASSSTDGSV